MATNTEMMYGNYSFSPVPLLTINKEYQKTADGTPVGSLYRVTLEGTLTPLPSGTIGYDQIDTLQDDLIAAFDEEGQLFKVSCGGNTLIEVYPRITDIELRPSNNNWVMTCPYTISLEFDGSGTPEYISTASEEWSIEFLEENSYHQWTLDDSTVDTLPYALRLNHTISAVGKTVYESAGGTTGVLSQEAWKEARDFILTRIGSPDTTFVVNSGIINLDSALMGYFNHMRTFTVNELGGEANLVESWLVLPTGITGVPGNALEDFTVDVRTSALDGLTTVSINGTIQGLEERTYGSDPGDFSVDVSKYDNALAYWNVVKTRLYWRGKEAADNTVSLVRNLHSIALNNSIGHNPSKGTITYAYEFNDRQCSMISGSRYENIDISETYPTDIFAEIVVPGRARGPIFQDMSTITASTRSVNIEVIMDLPSGECDSCENKLSFIGFSVAPTGEVAELLCCLEAELTGSYSQVFKTQDTASWNPLTGRYTRNVAWAFTNCSGDAPSTSFC